jgi:hypothetical protein
MLKERNKFPENMFAKRVQSDWLATVAAAMLGRLACLESCSQTQKTSKNPLSLRSAGCNRFTFIKRNESSF